MRNIDLLVKFEEHIGPLMSNYDKTFTTDEVENFLNDSLTVYIESMADRFEFDERARRSLENLVKSKIFYPTAMSVEPISDNSTFFIVNNNDNVLRIVEEQVIIGGERIWVKPVTHDQYLANRNNPFKKPYKKLAWRIDVDDRIEIVTEDGSTPTQYKIRVIEKPSKIDIMNSPEGEPELHDDALIEIVLNAVNLALRSLSVVSGKKA